MGILGEIKLILLKVINLAWHYFNIETQHAIFLHLNFQTYVHTAH